MKTKPFTVPARGIFGQTTVARAAEVYEAHRDQGDPQYDGLPVSGDRTLLHDAGLPFPDHS